LIAGRAKTFPRPATRKVLAIDGFGAVCGGESGWAEFVILSANAKQRRLFRGVLAHLTQLFRFVNDRAFRLILPALCLALILIALFLLARLFFLSFGKS
jgi:hypothetical protein